MLRILSTDTCSIQSGVDQEDELRLAMPRIGHAADEPRLAEPLARHGSPLLHSPQGCIKEFHDDAMLHFRRGLSGAIDPSPLRLWTSPGAAEATLGAAGEPVRVQAACRSVAPHHDRLVVTGDQDDLAVHRVGHVHLLVFLALGAILPPKLPHRQRQSVGADELPDGGDPEEQLGRGAIFRPLSFLKPEEWPVHELRLVGLCLLPLRVDDRIPSVTAAGGGGAPRP
mmetsp:Transcript_10809/g.34259  ORF Transcript_10809/g.34259 Transcript_10809/m.34259 type:complete len:226 (+) Transcript_10809:535-1212(+)